MIPAHRALRCEVDFGLILMEVLATCVSLANAPAAACEFMRSGHNSDGKIQWI
jgi:hypothetical protein